METLPIKFYGTSWCGDSRRAKAVFAELKVPYMWIDIDQNPQAAAFVKHVNRGLRRVPTLVFSDGSILVETESDILSFHSRFFEINPKNKPK
jgi:mycoredoxin